MRKPQSTPFLGLNAQPGDSGKLVVQGVVPGSAAEAAGLEPGDVLLKVGEIETRPDEDWGVKFRDRYRGQAGAPLVIGVTRAGRALSLSTQVRERRMGTRWHSCRRLREDDSQAEAWARFGTVLKDSALPGTPLRV